CASRSARWARRARRPSSIARRVQSRRAERTARAALLAAALAAAPLRAAAQDGAGAPLVSLAGDWSPAERRAVEATLARLPAAARARRRRVVARDARRCDGDGWPDDAALVDGDGRVHLCAPRATTPDAVAREVAGAVLFAFERAVGWSDDPSWRRLNR